MTNRLSQIKIKNLIERANEIVKERKKLQGELKEIEDQLSTEAIMQEVKFLTGKTIEIHFMQNTKSTLLVTEEKVYKGLKKKIDILQCANISCAKLKVYYENDPVTLAKLVKSEVDEYGKVTYRQIKKKK